MWTKTTVKNSLSKIRRKTRLVSIQGSKYKSELIWRLSIAEYSVISPCGNFTNNALLTDWLGSSHEVESKSIYYLALRTPLLHVSIKSCLAKSIWLLWGTVWLQRNQTARNVGSLWSEKHANASICESIVFDSAHMLRCNASLITGLQENAEYSIAQ